MKPAIEISDLFFRYPGSVSPVINGISLTIEEGEFVAVTGSNGSGKTTLCKCINGLVPHFYKGSFRGTVRVKGWNTQEKTVAELSGRVGYVGQDFERQLLCRTVWEEICVAPMNAGLPDYRARGEQVLRDLQLQGIRDRVIWQLSGGQKHLVAMAGVLAMDPDIILLDEPSAQLDTESAQQVYRVLRDLHTRGGKTLLVIEHQGEWIAEYCSRVLLLEKGHALRMKPVREAFACGGGRGCPGTPTPQVTQAAFLHNPAKAALELPLTVPEGIRFFSDTGFETGEKQEEPKKQKKAAEGLPILSVRQISYNCRSVGEESRRLLDDISFSVKEGERVAIVGRIGCGKTTLLRILAGILRPAGGCTEVCGLAQGQTPLEELGHLLMLIPQNPEVMFIEDSIEGDIGHYPARKAEDNAGCKAGRKDGRKNPGLEKILADFELERERKRDGRLLSGGEQKRAALAIGAAMHPRLLLLDEPTANLDAAGCQRIGTDLSVLGRYAGCMIAATHDLQMAAEWATRILVLSEGRLIADGSPSALLSDDRLLHSVGLMGPQIIRLSAGLGIRPAALSVEEFAGRLTSKPTKEGGADEILIW